jgi:hypothetical protein
MYPVLNMPQAMHNSEYNCGVMNQPLPQTCREDHQLFAQKETKE